MKSSYLKESHSNWVAFFIQKYSVILVSPDLLNYVFHL